MIGRIIEIKDQNQAVKELELIGSDKTGIKLMVPKAVSRAIKLKGIKPAAANIIKQEMLSHGGEAATAFGSINQSVELTDLLILGTMRQFGLLIEKLKKHQFGLPKIADEISLILQNYDAIPAPIEFKNRRFLFGQRTYLMGILNVTPDSFSDGGCFIKPAVAVKHAKEMLAEGADIIDVGGESSRPGAEGVLAEEEKKRVLPVIEKLAEETSAIISIDTTKAEVARAALSCGAAMVNDISALGFDSRMAELVAEYKVPLCIMHIRGTPGDMQDDPAYLDLMGEVINYLFERLEIAQKAGILLEQIIVDPGIGFGKTVEHNLEILRRLKELKVLGCPILVGSSRKSVIGEILNLPVEERLEGTAATVALAIANGADIIRVHDVTQMKRVAKMVDAIVRREYYGEEKG